MEVLPKLLAGYNKSYHRSIGTAPAKTTDDNAQKVWKRLYGTAFAKRETKVRFKFKVDDWVRVLKKKRTFEKGFMSNWTEEIFVVARRIARNPPVYHLKE